jgi:hypothetical protein
VAATGSAQASRRRGGPFVVIVVVGTMVSGPISPAAPLDQAAAVVAELSGAGQAGRSDSPDQTPAGRDRVRSGDEIDGQPRHSNRQATAALLLEQQASSRATSP